MFHPIVLKPILMLLKKRQGPRIVYSEFIANDRFTQGYIRGLESELNYNLLYESFVQYFSNIYSFTQTTELRDFQYRQKTKVPTSPPGNRNYT